MWVFLAMVALGAGSPSAVGQDEEPSGATGLIPPSARELAWMEKHWHRIQKVKPNALGLHRINEARRGQGMDELDPSVAALPGDETSGASGAEAVEPGVEDGASGLLVYVDNSLLPSFPPIGNQGSLGSCTSWATTYYHLTHAVGLDRGWSAKTDSSHRFSPKWSYNFNNGGLNQGTTFSGNYNVIARHGAASMADFPYDGDYKSWCLDPVAWRTAISCRANAVEYVQGVSGAGLEQVKALLANGHVIVFGTFINSWQWMTAADDPSTPDDDAAAGKYVGFWVNGTQGAHAMTFVGYNDAVWVDVNGNGAIDDGEKGALRVANSWGTGWREAGFTWLAYDALKSASAVAGAPATGRIGALMSDMVYHLTVKPSYEPKLLAEFTVTHALRSQLRMSLGISDTTASAPSTIWYPGAINLQGGAMAFDGGSVAVPGTFVFDFTDLLPAGTSSKRYYLGTYDAAAGSPATVGAFRLIDAAHGDFVVECGAVPVEADAGQVNISVDHTFSDGNFPPVAAASAGPLEGQEPLTVDFSASGSSDPDGTIVSYSWNFGDGATGSGLTVSHTYTKAGAYTAILTVTDDGGATATDSIAIDVLPDPAKVVFVGDIAMTLVTSKSGSQAKAAVLVLDAAGAPVSGATVSGRWSGLVTGTSTGTTKANGIVTLTSSKTKKRGTFTFTVTGIAATGLTYDASRNIETSDSITK